jgi:predicted dehydrogenase
MAKHLNVAMIGAGFMGKAHSNAYRQVARFFDLDISPVMKLICASTEGSAKIAAERYGWQEHTADWEATVLRNDIDLVDISTPGHLHCPMAVAAAKAGKHVWCEKPLANSVTEAETMLGAVESAGVAHAVFHNYRFCPAVRLAKRLLEDGQIGEIRHFRAVYLQDWIGDPQFPLVWRLQSKFSGTGALGDIGSHIIDLAIFLIGPINNVVGHSNTFIKNRPMVDDPDRAALVDVDDSSTFLAKFESGATGVFECSRLATGRKNFNCFEINGSRGSVRFNLERMNELEYFDGAVDPAKQGFNTILATDPTHQYAGEWWPPGHIIGYEHTFTNLVADGLRRIAAGELPSPNFQDGLQTQRVVEAVVRSVRTGCWEQAMN